MRALARLREWMDERYGWEDLVAPLRKKTVPLHRHSYWYFLGGMTLFLFLLQVLTGMLLLLYYRPGANEAYESVQHIMTRVQFGWLIRSVHSWAANLMVFFAFAHMFSVFFMKAYRKPRELTWFSGMVLLGLSMAFGFSGYLLPWNTLAFFATQVGTQIAGQVPFIGEWLVVFLRGGPDVTGATLSRFFGFHVAVLPAITTLFLLLHILLIQRTGMSVPDGVAAEAARSGKPLRQMPFFPNFVLREVMAWYVVLAILGTLAAFAPWELGTKADPFASAPAGIKPEWYFMFMFQTLKLIPAKLWIFDGEVVGVLAFGLAGMLCFLVPVFSRDSNRRVQKWVTGAGVFAVVYIVALTVAGYLAR